MIKNDLRSEFRGGNSPSHLEECYIPLSSYEVSPNELSQECSTKAIVSVGVPRPVDFTFVEGFTWQSSNSAVCNVLKISNFEAEVNFLTVGNCEITVSHPEVPNDIRIMCSSNAITLKSFALSTTALSQEYATSASVSVGSLVPTNFANVGGFVWSTSNTAVCTVTKNGNYGATINFIAQGACTITVKHPDLPAKTITCTSRAITLKSFTLNPASITKQTGNSTDVTITPVPANFTNVGGFTWSTNNGGVATVTKLNNLSASVNFAGVGNATITVAHPDVASKTIACVSQAIPVTSVTISGTPNNKPFESYQLGAQVLPANTTNKNVTWSSSSSALATVSTTGLVTNKNKPGTVTIMATSVSNTGVKGTLTNTIKELLDAWTKRNSGVLEFINCITYGNGLYVAAGGFNNARGIILTSPDTITWTKRDIELSASNSLQDITYDNGLYVVVGGFNSDGNIILTSPDTITWTQRTSGVTEQLNSITYGNGLYVAVGNKGTILTSPDTITWTKRDSGVTGYLDNIIYNNGLYVTVGDRGTILTSPDGITWTKRTSGVTDFLQGITYGNGIYVVVGDTGTILTSPDTITWTKRDSGVTTDYLRDITYGNGLYVAVGSSGTILTSPNGITWTKRDSGGTNSLYGITYGNGLYVIVGWKGTILTCRML